MIKKKRPWRYAAMCNVKINLFANMTARTNPKAVTNDQHANHELGVDRRIISRYNRSEVSMPS